MSLNEAISQQSEIVKAQLIAGTIRKVTEYIAECEEQEGDEYWSRSSVEDHLHDFGLYVQYTTE